MANGKKPIAPHQRRYRKQYPHIEGGQWKPRTTTGIENNTRPSPVFRFPFIFSIFVALRAKS